MYRVDTSGEYDATSAPCNVDGLGMPMVTKDVDGPNTASPDSGPGTDQPTTRNQEAATGEADTGSEHQIPNSEIFEEVVG